MNTFATQKLKTLHNFSLQNKAFTYPRSWVLITLMLAIALYGHPAFSQDIFKSDEIELTIPSDFERIGNPSALVVLRDKTQGFPTFNAVLAPGPWPYSKLDLQTQGQKVIDDYHLVGLKNAEATSIDFYKIDSHQALHTRVHYNAGQNEFSSEIWIIPLIDRHIILTAVYKGQALPEAEKRVNQIIESVLITTPPPTEAPKESFFFENAFILICGLIALLLTIVILRRRKKLIKNVG